MHGMKFQNAETIDGKLQATYGNIYMCTVIWGCDFLLQTILKWEYLILISQQGSIQITNWSS